MGRKYIFHDSTKLYFVSFAFLPLRIGVFVKRIYFDIVVNSLDFCIKDKGLELYAWCIMPSHVHLIISSEKGKLSDIIRDLKRHTAKELIACIDSNDREVGENGIGGGVRLFAYQFCRIRICSICRALFI